MTVVYEWDCETVADGDSSDFEDGEVLDHAHGASFKSVFDWAASKPLDAGARHELVLVRDDDEGRSWAYVKDGKLPVYFTDAYGGGAAKVPQRFHAEVARSMTTPAAKWQDNLRKRRKAAGLVPWIHPEARALCKCEQPEDNGCGIPSTIRERFEEWARDAAGLDVRIEHSESPLDRARYARSDTALAWEAWQAATEGVPALLEALRACRDYLSCIPESAAGGDDEAVSLVKRATAVIAKAQES